jgi:nucleoside triphosphatase
MASNFRCVIHGSFGRHFTEIKQVQRLFTQAGIEVLAPKAGELVGTNGGFALFDNELDQDPRLVELLYLHNLKKLGPNGFSYFVNPEGYIGRSASYELGIAQITNTPCFFSHILNDHPAYVQPNAIWPAEALAERILTKGELPEPSIRRDERQIHRLWKELMVPGSVVAAGAIIEYQRPRKNRGSKEILLVKTHKWGHRYSIVGGKVRRNELLKDALLREAKEETGLSGEVGRHICTFDQIKNSGYFRASVQHIFVDNVVKVAQKKVQLNEEAQEYIWTTAEEALQHLDIEPNARMTVELYAKTQVA